jgi:hypothetical protein
MATQKTVAQVLVFPSPETAIVEQRQIPNLKEALLDKLRDLIWRYACPRCNAKRFTNTGAGLLCARCFGRTRRDIRKIVAYLAAAGRI